MGFPTKHIRIIFATAALVGFAAPVFADDPVSVSKSDALSPGDTWELRITSRADITIKNLVVNRGCEAQEGRLQFPQKLNFGETKHVGYYLCDPIEVQVTTDQGSQTFKWDAFTQNSLSVSKNAENSAVWKLILTSRADSSLAIKNVIVNRGHCEVSAIRNPEREHDSAPLKFGQRYILMTWCNPIEIHVTTDQGSSTFTWNE
jgi:hypothetical protein